MYRAKLFFFFFFFFFFLSMSIAFGAFRCVCLQEKQVIRGNCHFNRINCSTKASRIYVYISTWDDMDIERRRKRNTVKQKKVLLVKPGTPKVIHKTK